MPVICFAFTPRFISWEGARCHEHLAQMLRAVFPNWLFLWLCSRVAAPSLPETVRLTAQHVLCLPRSPPPSLNTGSTLHASLATLTSNKTKHTYRRRVVLKYHFTGACLFLSFGEFRQGVPMDLRRILSNSLRAPKRSGNKA